MNVMFLVFVALALFAVGALTVLLHRSAVIALMGVEIMLNSCNIALVALGEANTNMTGQVLAFFVMTVAAAEVVVGLALIVSLFRSRRTTTLDDFNLLNG